MFKFRQSIIIIALLFILTFGFASLFLIYKINMPGPEIQENLVYIPKGTSDVRIANLLKEKGIIENKNIFLICIILFRKSGDLKAGEYYFSSKTNLISVIDRISKGKIYSRRLTIPEGLTSKQIIDVLYSAEGLSGDILNIPEEGTLLPETYFYHFNDTKQSIIIRMQKSMKKSLKEVWLLRDSNLLLRDSKDALILASVIEKESGLINEKSHISGVFHNRLKKKMLLQSDPTVIYGLMKVYEKNTKVLSKQDLNLDTPWNTYLYRGLPPTPISNPGINSLLAAVLPLETDDLYFVADGYGGHNFSSSLKEHNRNVRVFRKIIRCKKYKDC